MDIEHKSIQFKFKEESPGAFVARIAQFNVLDADGDVTIPGAFPAGKNILISSYQHGSWMGELPVGRAVIGGEADGFAIADGQFNLATASGKEHYEAVKFSAELQEWSYGFKVLEQGNEEEIEAWAKEHDGARPNRILKKVDPFEISPVLKGAGAGTATMAIKAESKGAISYQRAHPDGTPKAAEDAEWSASKEVKEADVDDLKVMCTYVDSDADPENKGSYKLPHHQASGKHPVVWKGVAASMSALMGARGGVAIPESARKGVYNHLVRHYKEFEKEPPEFRSVEEGFTYADQAEAVLAGAEDLVARTKSLADLRRKDGRELSISNRDRIKKLHTSMGDVVKDLKELLESTEPMDKDAVLKLQAEFTKIESEILEVSLP